MLSANKELPSLDPWLSLYRDECGDLSVSFRIKTLTSLSPLLIREATLCILSFQLVQILYIFNEDVRVLVAKTVLVGKPQPRCKL